MEQGNLASACDLKDEEKVLVNDLHLLTLKPILYIYNISDKNAELPEELKKKNHVLLDIKTEEDLMEMSEQDKKELGVESNIGPTDCGIV